MFDARPVSLAVLMLLTVALAACDDATPGTQPTCVAGCMIDSVCYPDTVTSPFNVCLICDRTRSTTNWSGNDTATCDDGLDCTTGDKCLGGLCSGATRECDDGIACNGVETCAESTGCLSGSSTCDAGQLCDLVDDRCVGDCPGCAIGGTCYGDGQLNPANTCEICDPATIGTAWTDNDGVVCEDGLFCTTGDSCSNGTCTGTTRNCDDGIACTTAGVCNETANTCMPGSSLCGINQVCGVHGLCVNQCTGCVVASVCYGAQQTNPMNPCLICNPTQSSTAWSHNNGAACDDLTFCNGIDVCQGGACTPGPTPACTSDGFFCNGTESCDEVNDRCLHSGDPCTSNGNYCDGFEYCTEAAGGACQSSGSPCGADQSCDDGLDKCCELRGFLGCTASGLPADLDGCGRVDILLDPILYSCLRDGTTSLYLLLGPGVDLQYANLESADLSYAVLVYANLSFANLSNANLTGADLRWMSAISITGCPATLPSDWRCRAQPDFGGYALLGPRARLVDIDLGNASLSDVDLTSADLGGADLVGASFTNAILTGADLSGASLPSAVLDSASLANTSFAGADLAGVSIYSNNCNGGNFVSATLTSADVQYTSFINADMSGVDMTGTTARGADFTNATLVGADLANVNFREADLEGADLTGANLSGITWNDTTCPDGSNSDDNGDTCIGHL